MDHQLHDGRYIAYRPRTIRAPRPPSRGADGNRQQYESGGIGEFCLSDPQCHRSTCGYHPLLSRVRHLRVRPLVMPWHYLTNSWPPAFTITTLLLVRSPRCQQCRAARGFGVLGPTSLLNRRYLRPCVPARAGMSPPMNIISRAQDSSHERPRSRRAAAGDTWSRLYEAGHSGRPAGYSGRPRPLRRPRS